MRSAVLPASATARAFLYRRDALGPSPCAASAAMAGHAEAIAFSFKKLVGRALLDEEAAGPPRPLWAALLEHPRMALLSVGTQPNPLLNYGNNAALALFEMSWEQLTVTPGSLTAQLEHEREERQRLLDGVTANGFVLSYSGVRVSATGRRFRIRDAAVFNIVEDGEYKGQAAWFSTDVAYV
jgi:hypothetical protein